MVLGDRWQLQGLVLGLLFCVCVCIKNDPGLHYLNSFIVRVNGDSSLARDIADELGFRVKREIPTLDAYEFEHRHLSITHRSKRSHQSLVEKLQLHPYIYHAEQQESLERVKREIIYGKDLDVPIRALEDKSVYYRYKEERLVKKDKTTSSPACKDFSFNDKYYRDQWYLCNWGQTRNGTIGVDLNVVVAWQNNITGRGVVVTNLDDGLDHTHPDLIDNYDPEASADLNDPTDQAHDPMPNDKIPDNSHGTRCGGEIAAKADNGICGVGVAYNAKIGGIRILDGKVTDSKEAEALNFRLDHIWVYCASWGPRDDGKTMEAPRPMTAAALQTGVRTGRNGKGAIYVWATGNGGMNDDDCNCDGYVSSIESLSVGSITELGMRPYFMEICASTFAVVPTGGEEFRGQDKGRPIIRIVTTDLHHGCIENFQGTSAAAPLAAGCVALTLEANPNLTWRDVQHIVVNSAKLTSKDDSWLINGAGKHVSHKFGFGVMDCGRMVQLAQEWNNVPEQHVCHTPMQTNEQTIASGGYASTHLYTDGCKDDSTSRIDTLEHVQLHIRVGGGRRGNLQIVLTSPSGTKSEMLKPRKKDVERVTIDFTFMTVHTWAENPRGKWSLTVFDNPHDSSQVAEHTLTEWKLIFYGSTALSVGSRGIDKPGQRAYQPSTEELDGMMLTERQTSTNVAIKRNDGVKRNNIDQHVRKELNDQTADTTSVIDELYNSLRNILSDNPDLSLDDNKVEVISSKKRKYNSRKESAEKRLLGQHYRDNVDQRQYERRTNKKEKSQSRTELLDEINNELEDILQGY